MIDEDVLRSLLAEVADAAPAPGTLPGELLDALAAERSAVPAPRRSWPTGRVLAAAAAVVVLLVGVAAMVTGGEDNRDVAATVDRDMPVGDDPGFGTTGGASPDAYTSTTAPLPYDDARATGSVGEGAEVARDGSVAGRSGGGSGAAGDGALVIKTAALALEVDRGAYDRTLTLMTTKAAGLGGYVAQSTTSRSDGGPSGTLVVRVPAPQFDGLLADLRKLGEVISEDSRGTDVTGQQADLEARLRSVQATRDRLSAVLAQTDTVEEILAVQDRITSVQTEIEQLQGQLATMADQVAMASITVSFAEPGADQVRIDDGDRGVGGAWADARRRFGDGIEGLVSWSGSAAVVALVALVVAALLRLGRDRLRRLFL